MPIFTFQKRTLGFVASVWTLIGVSVVLERRASPESYTDPRDAHPAAASPQAVQPADMSVLPQRYQSYRDPQGSGMAVYGVLNGNPRSAGSVLLALLEARTFDDLPVLQTVVADQGDQHVQALFSARMNGTPVLGVATVDLGDSGGSVTLLFDRPQSFRYSFSRLRQGLAKSGGRHRAEVPLEPIRLADGSALSIPQGWRVSAQGRGSVDLDGPNGEAISLGAAAPVYNRVQRLPYMPAGYVFQAPCCDPVRAYVALVPQISAAMQKLGRPPQQLVGIVESQPTAWGAGQAAFLLTELRIGGRPYLNYALVAAMPSYSDPWTVYISAVAAPEEIFGDEFSMMLKVWGSYTINPAVFAERLQHAAQTMKETQQMMRDTMAETSRAMQSAHEGWDQVIRGVQTIENTNTGRRWTVDNEWSQQLVDRLSTDTGNHWRIVPSSELVLKP
jgi:hypothetical protein